MSIFVSDQVRLGSSGSKKITSIAFKQSVVSTTTSLTLPTGLAANTIGILLNNAWANSNTIATTVVPSGWTSIANNSASGAASGIKGICSYKIFTTSDSGATITGMTGTNGQNMILLVFQANKIITTPTFSTASGEATTSAPATQTVSIATIPTNPVVGIAHYASEGTIGTRTSSITMQEVTSGVQQYAKYVTYNYAIARSNFTVSLGDSGINCLQSFYFTLD